MTAEEAIKEIRQDICEYHYGCEHCEEAGCEYWLAMEALKKQGIRQKTCMYCNEDVDGYVKPIEKNCHAFIRLGMNGWCLNIRAKGWNGEAKINYCPMCGRGLTSG